jgi:hypothetical protein
MDKVTDSISLTGHTDVVSSIAWNVSHKAQMMATSCKDKKLRVYDPRASPKAIQVPHFLFLSAFLFALIPCFYRSALPTREYRDSE